MSPISPCVLGDKHLTFACIPAETNVAMFPLPLTCLEEYMLCDDRPAYPMTAIYRLRFSGFLDRTAFETAVANAVRRHPLLRATVERKRRGRPQWVDHPDWLPTVEWQAEANRFGFPRAGHMDLTEQPGTRFWVLDRDDGHDLIAQVHHCCADGQGMSKVMEDLLIGYASALDTTAAGISLPEVDLRLLLRRGAPGLTAGKFLAMAHKQARGLIGALRFLSHSPVPLAAAVGEIEEALPPATFPTPLAHEFDQDETKRITATAKSLKVTVNDFLVRDLFLAMGAWRKKREIGTDRDWIRFSIPISLRRAVDEQMPMVNSVSCVFLDRQPKDFADAGQLLEGIRAQMGLIKRLQLQYTFILSLGIVRWMPGGISRKVRADRCQLTSWMSNLGPVLTRTPLPRREGRLVSGNVVLESVDYVIPLRPHVNASFCVYTYAGRLRVLMHYDPRAIADERSEDLLETYIRQIRRTIDDGNRLS